MTIDIARKMSEETGHPFMLVQYDGETFETYQCVEPIFGLHIRAIVKYDSSLIGHFMENIEISVVPGLPIIWSTKLDEALLGLRLFLRGYEYAQRYAPAPRAYLAPRGCQPSFALDS